MALNCNITTNAFVVRRARARRGAAAARARGEPPSPNCLDDIFYYLFYKYVKNNLVINSILYD